MGRESEQLEAKVKELEDKIVELEKKFKTLLSAHSILIEQYALVEDRLYKLSKTLELSSTPLVSPLHILELQDKGTRQQSKSRLDQLIDKVVDSIFEDYKQQFRGEQ